MRVGITQPKKKIMKGGVFLASTISQKQKALLILLQYNRLMKVVRVEALKT